MLYAMPIAVYGSVCHIVCARSPSLSVMCVVQNTVPGGAFVLVEQRSGYGDLVCLDVFRECCARLVVLVHSASICFFIFDSTMQSTCKI